MANLCRCEQPRGSERGKCECVYVHVITRFKVFLKRFAAACRPTGTTLAEFLIEAQDENYPNVLTSSSDYYQDNNTEFFPWQANPRAHFTGNKHACFTGKTFLTADTFGVSQITHFCTKYFIF